MDRSRLNFREKDRVILTQEIEKFGSLQEAALSFEKRFLELDAKLLKAIFGITGEDMSTIDE